jgi:hypothetical protein
MAKKFAYLRQRSSLPEHLTGECVPELVSSFAGSTNPGPYQRMANHGGDPGLTLETYGGRSRPEEYASTAGGRPPVPQIVSDGRTDFARQGQLRIAARLPAHGNQSLLPIQIFQGEHSDLTGAQTQARQDQENRIVSAADSRLPVDGSQHEFYLIWRKGARYGR